MTDPATHWSAAWRDAAPETKSWHQDDPAPSLAAIEASGIAPDRPLIDVGGGAARLVDRLLDRGWTDLSVLDVAAEALDRARDRLGARAARVRWIVADVTRWTPERAYALWHDRAVFHFLTTPEDRAAYARTLDAALAPDGQAILATFALDGPERCSGLPVQRHDAASLEAALGPGFRLVETRRETHVTPAGAEQRFLRARFARA